MLVRQHGVMKSKPGSSVTAPIHLIQLFSAKIVQSFKKNHLQSLKSYQSPKHHPNNIVTDPKTRVF